MKTDGQEQNSKELERLDEILEFDSNAQTKSFQQLLAENPHHKGGQAQLALAELNAEARFQLERGKGQKL